MNTKQKDIARATGMSTTSVSLVLSGRPNKLSKETRDHILRMASDMGYKQERSKRLSSRNADCIGMIVPRISNSFFAEIVQGASDCIQARGWRLLLVTNDGSPEKDRAAVKMMKDSRVSAVLLTSSEDCPASMFEALSCPVIQVDRHSPALHFSSVVLNNKKGGFISTKHLLDLGHRKIACITGPQKLISARERLEGYYWAFQARDLPSPAPGVFEGDYLYESGYALADKIISSGFTAVVCGNDIMAFGLCKRCRELGVSIPNDLSVVGFDNLIYSELLDPPLTTVSQSSYAIGSQACQRAFFEIENPRVSKQTILFEPELVVRKSTVTAQGNRG